MLDELHGLVSVETMRRLVPGVARRALARARMQWRTENDPHPNRLRWSRPGAVWAMDYTELPRRLADGSRYILLVRDLASRMMLATMACRQATAESTVLCVRSLVRAHGAPLVVKSDNGSHFIAQSVGKMLASLGIEHLRSPVRTPQYNGAIEAGAGALKQSLAGYGGAGDGERWLESEDIEAERWRSNETARPLGRSGPSALEYWRSRGRIGARTRARFRATVMRTQHEHTASILSRRQSGGTGCEELSQWEQAMVARSSIRRTLAACGLMEVRNTRS